MSDNMIYLDRNEFNFEPSSLVKETFRNFDINTLCFYTRIYDQGKKSILSVYLSELYGIDERQVILGYGAEDLLKMAIHFFLTEGDNRTILIPKFSWWYYKSIASEVNGVTDFYPLYETEDSFRYDLDELEQIVKEKRPRILLIASPNNPTGNNLDRDDIIRVIEHFDGLVVVDETYADFSNERQFSNDLNRWPNLVVLHSLNAAYGCAALSVGMAYASADIIAIMDKVKYPYNVNTPSQKQATEAIKAFPDMNKWVKILLLERGRMIEAFSLLPICEAVYPTNANFFLAKMTDATAIHDYLKRQGIMVRNCTDMPLCHNCLRITVGTKSENNQLLSALRQY